MIARLNGNTKMEHPKRTNTTTARTAARRWTVNEMEYKADKGKPRLFLVPPSLIEAVGIVRTYGVQKYGEEQGWRKVEPWRNRDIEEVEARFMRECMECELRRSNESV